MAERLTFLTLVPEIRHQIYEHVLGSPIAPPKSPSASGPRLSPDSLEFSDIPETTTYYPVQPFPWPGAGLVRTCQQVRTEVSALARVIENRNRAKKRVDYQLDIMIHGECTLYPTWVNLPLASPAEQRSVNQIWADLRTIGVFDPPTRRGRRRVWTDSNAWSPSLFWGLFAILNRFFAYGISFQKICLSNRIGHAGETHVGMEVPHVEELVLNVVTPTKDEREGRSNVDAYKWKSVGVLRPERLVEILEGYIKYLEHPASYAAKNASQYDLLEKLGKIRLCVDGKEVGSWRFSPHLGC